MNAAVVKAYEATREAASALARANEAFYLACVSAVKSAQTDGEDPESETDGSLEDPEEVEVPMSSEDGGTSSEESESSSESSEEEPETKRRRTDEKSKAAHKPRK